MGAVLSPEGWLTQWGIILRGTSTVTNVVSIRINDLAQPPDSGSTIMDHASDPTRKKAGRKSLDILPILKLGGPGVIIYGDAVCMTGEMLKLGTPFLPLPLQLPLGFPLAFDFDASPLPFLGVRTRNASVISSLYGGV